jgi:hypothetical protein
MYGHFSPSMQQRPPYNPHFISEPDLSRMPSNQRYQSNPVYVQSPQMMQTSPNYYRPPMLQQPGTRPISPSYSRPMIPQQTPVFRPFVGEPMVYQRPNLPSGTYPYAYSPQRPNIPPPRDNNPSPVPLSTLTSPNRQTISNTAHSPSFSAQAIPLHYPTLQNTSPTLHSTMNQIEMNTSNLTIESSPEEENMSK